MKTVVLDPGHGIETSGKRSPDGRLREYEFNRAVAGRMKPMLVKMGYKVIITCSSANEVDLNERCSIANKANADIFISIHANAFGNGWNDADGWEVLIKKRGGESEKLAMLLEKESKVLALDNRGIKTRDDLCVLNGTKMPAVLIEFGFMTDKEECQLLLSGAFRTKAAAATCKAIDAYLKGRK
jgi:N-acetylmuramoyl-L-alanine amidase